MRDTYAKSIRKGVKSSQTLRARPRRRYIYAKQLSFLYESKALPEDVLSNVPDITSSSFKTDRTIPRHRNEFKSSLLNFMHSPIVVDPLDAEDNEVDHIDIRLLINQVKQYREIWDVRSEAYKDRGKRQLAWEKIYENLFQEYNQKTKNEKNAIIKKLSLKWKNMRDAYGKSIRKGIVSNKTPRSRPRRQYIYARQLSFLHETMSLTHKMSSSPYKTTLSPSARTTAPRQQRELKSSLINFIKSPTLIDPPDADRSFFESLIPIVRQFTEDQKLEFWSDVIAIIRNIKRKSAILQETQHNPTQTLVPTDISEGEISEEIKPSLMHLM
ncbi:hypothetical protein WA026_004025 [Henosepilachna vigintioctopunctata]